MKQQKMLVIGGNGKTGRRVIERLTKRGCSDVRAGSRGVKWPFDWNRPETWAPVLAGREVVYVTFQPDLAIPTAAGTIEKFVHEATAAGIQKVVLLSGRGEPEAQVCEQKVMNAMANSTIVRASWFNQNFSEGFFLDPVLAGAVALPRAEALEPFIDADDIADVVVEAMLDDKHNGKVYDLTGPRLLTFGQAVEEIAHATGRSIAFQSLTIEAYTSGLRSYALPEDYIWLINYLFTEVLDGRNATVTNDVEKVLGRKARDFSAYVRETAATGVWDADRD